MGSPHPKDLQISFGGFTQLVELDLGPIPGSRICELVNCGVASRSRIWPIEKQEARIA